MTIGCWVSVIIGVIVLLVGLVFDIDCLKSNEVNGGVGCIMISILLAISFIIIPIIYSNTESGKRALKDQQSNFNNGIERIVEVYDVNGELIKTYEGRFDVETNPDSKYIKFDDENNKRHMIYYTTGTVVITEK